MEPQIQTTQKSTENTSLPKPKGKTLKRLSKKEKGFIRDYVRTGNGTQSALKNYDTKDYSTAGAISSENLRKPRIIEAIKSMADRIPDELLEKVHLEGLNASITRSIGEDMIKEPDYSVRHKYLDSAYKLKGSFAPEKSLNVNVSISTENREKMTNLAKEVSDKLIEDEIKDVLI